MQVKATVIHFTHTGIKKIVTSVDGGLLSGTLTLPVGCQLTNHIRKHTTVPQRKQALHSQLNPLREMKTQAHTDRVQARSQQHYG